MQSARPLHGRALKSNHPGTENDPKRR